MRKYLIGSAAVLALVAGSAGSKQANACEAIYDTGTCFTAATVGNAVSKVIPYVTAAGVVALGVYLIANHDAPAGSLAAEAPDENMRQFLANAKAATPTPAYNFVSVVPANYNLAAVK